MPELRLHDLRHSYASFLVNAGRSLYEVQKLLGHHDPKVTMRYAHLSPQAMLEAVNVVGNVVGRRPMVANQAEICPKSVITFRTTLKRKGARHIGVALSFQIKASRPLRSSRLSSFCDGPLGCLSPSSHWRTADGLVLSSDANTVWLSW